MIFLEQLEVEAFRGFAARQSIRLDSDAIVIHGANGLGKTSLTDALMWVLTGNLPQMPERKGRRDEEFVVNRYREGEDAEVILHVQHQEQSLRLERRGSSKSGSALTIESGGERFVGKNADERLWKIFGADSQRALQLAVEGWGILRQDAMRAVLSAPAEEFQSRLRDILGLRVLADFEKAAKEAHRRSADEASTARAEANATTQAASRAEAEMHETRTLVADAAGHDTRIVEVMQALRALRDVVTVDESALRSAEAARELSQTAKRLETELRAASSRMTQLLAQIGEDENEVEGRLLASRESLSDLENELRGARETHAAAEQRFSALQARAADMTQLAALALPLLDEECPVCASQIRRDVVVRRLRAILDEGHESSDLEASSQAVAHSRDLVSRLESQFRAQVESSEILRARVARRLQAIEQLQGLREQVAAAARGAGFTLPLLARTPVDPSAIERSAAALFQLERHVSSIVRSARDRSVEHQLPRLQLRLRESQEVAAAATRKLEALARRESEAKLLADAATTASLDVTEDALDALGPYFGEVFRRLAAHPTFSELGLQHDVYYGKARTWARLTDPVTGLEANPQLICSEGQLNVVALSYFVAFALTAQEKSLPFVILDDPLQSLDDMNVLGFADLCRHLRDGRQVIVTTHDARFAGLLTRKLKPRQLGQTSGRIQFLSWDREGPKLKSERFGGEMEPVLLELANGDGTHSHDA